MAGDHQRETRIAGQQQPGGPGRLPAGGGEPVGQAAQHEHEDDQGERLDEELGERQVGRAVQHEQQRHAETDAPEGDDGGDL